MSRRPFCEKHPGADTELIRLRYAEGVGKGIVQRRAAEDDIRDLCDRVEALEVFAKLVRDWCEGIGTGTGGDGDALNICSDLYQKARAALGDT